jgi:hypothetical protein
MEYSGLVVLIVEDNPDDLELILDTFGKAPITSPSKLPETARRRSIISSVEALTPGARPFHLG